MEIVELISLAKAALESDIKSDQFITGLERYSNAFDQWFPQNSAKLSNISDQLFRDQVDQLVELHEKLVEIVSGQQSEHPEDMKRLKQKGKGIMAYTDLLPKRLSMRRPRQG